LAIHFGPTVPTEFKDAFIKAFADACGNSHVHVDIRVEDRVWTRHGLAFWALEHFRDMKTVRPVVESSLKSETRMILAGRELGVSMAEQINKHDKNLFDGFKVIDLVSQEYEHGWTNNKKTVTKLAKERSDGMCFGLSAKEESIYKGLLRGDWEARADERVRALEEKRRQRDHEAVHRQAEFAREQQRIRDAVRAAQEAEEIRIRDKQTFYDDTGDYGQF
jgi:hypothetical protein